MNIASKDVRAKTGYSGSKMFAGMCVVGTCISLPLVLKTSYMPVEGELDSVEMVRDAWLQATVANYWPLALMVLAGPR